MTGHIPPRSDLERLDDVEGPCPRGHDLSRHEPSRGRLQAVGPCVEAGVDQEVHGRLKGDLLQRGRVGGDGQAVEALVEPLARHVVRQQGQVPVVDHDLVGAKHALDFLQGGTDTSQHNTCCISSSQ